MMTQFDWKVAITVLGIALLLITGEAIWSRKKNKNVFDSRETRQNLLIFLGMRISSYLASAWVIFMLQTLNHYSSRSFAPGLFSIAAALLAFDFLYYWQHRMFHHSPVLWAFHGIHHQSRFFNYTSALRLPWFAPLLTPIFYAPLALLGFSEMQILAAGGVNLLYQFFLHTQAVPRIPFVEGILNTPEAHRVHHGRNGIYRDKNFGGMLMIWDRLFGTYQAERPTLPIQYGTDEYEPSQGIILAVFGGFKGLRWNRGFWRDQVFWAARNGSGWIALLAIACLGVACETINLQGVP